MAPTQPTQERTANNRLFAHRFPTESVDDLWTWLVFGAIAVGYTGLSVGLVAVALITAVYLGTLLPGLTGVVAFLTVGLGLVAAAPVAARRLAIDILDAMPPHPPE